MEHANVAFSTSCVHTRRMWASQKREKHPEMDVCTLLAFLEPVFPTSFFLTIIQMKSQGK